MATWPKDVTVAPLIVTIVLAVATVGRAENWPCFRGPSHQGISHETKVPTEWSGTTNVLWKTPIPGQGWSSPIVFEDRVFVTTATEKGASFRLVCLDRGAGEILWDRQVTRQKAGHKQNLNSYASSTPATDGKYVYVLAADGTFACISYDGKVRWTRRHADFYGEHGLAVSLLLYNDLLIAPFDGSSPGPDNKLGWQTPWDKAVIFALNKDSGTIRWRGQRGLSRIAHVTPQIVTHNGIDQLVSGAGDVIQGFDPTTGERIWTVTSAGEGVVPSIVAGDGLVFATSGFGESAIRAVRLGGTGDVTKTHIAWEVTEDVPKIPSMLYSSPYLFLIMETGLVKCLNGADGREIWRERLGGRYSASPVLAEGKIYFLSEQGKMTIIEAGPDFKILVENEVGEKCCASPAISNGCLFIRGENHLYCIGPKE